MEGGPPRFPRDSPCPAVLGRKLGCVPALRLRGSHPLWPAFPGCSARTATASWGTAAPPSLALNPTIATAAALARSWFGLNPFRSPRLRVSRLFPLPRGTEMFQFPRFPSPAYGFSWRYPGITRGGLPHSDTRGSQPVDGSPRLFAVPRVLLRPLAPRHPPRAPSRSAPPLGSPKPPQNFLCSALPPLFAS